MNRGRTSRYLSLVLWAALLLSPSMLVAGGALAAGAAVLLGPAAWRRIRRRRQRGSVAGDRPGVMLGADPGGRPVALGDRQLAAHSLIVGASGAGKSTTMLALLDAQIRAGAPVIAIDMKGSRAFMAQIQAAAAAAGRGVRVWTPDGCAHWNPLAHGNATSLKDKLISTERFSEPHYQRAAERYVQTALGVLHVARPHRAAQLHEVVALMEPRRLSATLRSVPRPLAEQVQDYIAGLTPDQVSAVRGLGTRLALLSESCAGPYLRTGPPETTIDVRRGLEGGDVILFSLNSSVYGKLAAQLGALVIQDLVSATGTRLDGRAAPDARPPAATVAIDEFSALEGDNLLALLARGREFGVRVLIATQEMADLERAGRGFRDQVLGIVGVKIVHRQDVPASADTVAQMVGTERVWERTEQVGGMFAGGRASRGTRRVAERYIVHPNVIKRLPVGQAVVLTKLPTAQVQRVAVTPPRPPLPGRPPRRMLGGGSVAPDGAERGGGSVAPGGAERGAGYPAPGVTR